MSDEHIRHLRNNTRHLFFHGYENYIAHAFPEDELKPLSCGPQTRNRYDPRDIGLNDVLGNYSLTLVDSLSTLAIFASDEDQKHGAEALIEFQAGVREMVRLYGDGTEKGRCGERACGFDLDSKVQVFETNIRGVGGLLSAHLFATGDLPIRNYQPKKSRDKHGNEYIAWPDFRYDGQLLRLAHDLASRLLPAFNTTTGLPYPRVNLRDGIPFYVGSETGICRLDGTSTEPREITETCAAGAGSLVLEFSTLSRLTGDGRFEKLAKRAFWSVWARRSNIDLIGNGIDAESGMWMNPPLAGVGAGIDSWFEYAVKTYVLLSGLPYTPEEEDESDPDKFLEAWKIAHGAVKRHIFRSSSNEGHAFYAQVDLSSGAPRYSWIDNLSAYYPGLLTLSGELEEAIEAHMVYAALWNRYGALPERWHTVNGYIDANFKHWAGRPEFIESTYYLHQATKDPWYLHIGEMALRDIRRRCWTRCGWADLGDVITGQQRDRMESFFLGETAKYLYLLFSESHPLNTLDAPIIFTTEGHPLVIPKRNRLAAQRTRPRRSLSGKRTPSKRAAVCPSPPPPIPLTVSNIANRSDLFHAASLAQLHLVSYHPARASSLERLLADTAVPETYSDLESPTNFTYYPWTLPVPLIPPQATSRPISNAIVNTLTFPNLQPDNPLLSADRSLVQANAVDRVAEGILVHSLSNIRFNMIQERRIQPSDHPGIAAAMQAGRAYRINGIINVALGLDEKVLLSSEALRGISPADPHFTKIQDVEMADLVIDLPKPVSEPFESLEEELHKFNSTNESFWSGLDRIVTSMLSSPQLSDRGKELERARQAALTFDRVMMPAILATGEGAAPLPATVNPGGHETPSLGFLPFRKVYFLNSTLCDDVLPLKVAKEYDVLIILRGGCSFGEKLANVPETTTPTSTTAKALSLVIVLSISSAINADGTKKAKKKNDEEADERDWQFIRPLIDTPQTTPDGSLRLRPLALIMVEGTPERVGALRRVAKTIARVDERGSFQEEQDEESQKEQKKKGKSFGKNEMRAGEPAPGMTVKSRFWFESLGIPITNLIVL